MKNSRLMLAGSAAMVASLIGWNTQAQPAFPGAQGFGAVATGGRGGQVIKVTTLNATGPGSLQAALDATGPRIVVFTVSGVIEGDITIENGDVTIAGQTAPGGGITIGGRLFGRYDYSVGNIIIRHVRVRPTYNGGNGDQFDGIQLSRNSQVILDHVSVSWGVDETVDMYEAQEITVQYSTIAEGGTVGHSEGMHNYGLINGPNGRYSSIHHNLFVHQRNRNPAIANGPSEVFNNVVYNVRHGFVHHNPASGPFNIVGNAYLAGDDDNLFPFFFDDENNFGAPDLSYYLADNYIDDPGTFTGIVDNPWTTPFDHPSFEYLSAPEALRSGTIHDFANATTGYVAPTIAPSQQAMTDVLSCAGAFPRDVVTRRVLDDVQMRTGSWGVVAPSDLMEGLTPTSAPTDGDDDGMPDDWETDNGLDPNDGADHSTVMAGGYTAIETYINELADSIACGASPNPPGTGGGGAGGNGSGAGAGSGNGTGVGGNGSNGSGGQGDGPTGDDGGCGCRIVGGQDDDTPLTTLALLGLCAAVARRRRR